MKPLRISRRRFLGSLAILGGSVVFPLPLLSRQAGGVRAENSPDDAICEALFARWERQGLRGCPIGELVGTAGRSFLNAPYRANTLEEPGEEHLVVNIREFDCVTFFESSLALARSFALGGTRGDDFRAQLRHIRYRGGTINGYPSRLHYFSDWVRDNVAKQVVTDATPEHDRIRDRRILNFMSTHPASYRQLTSDDVSRAIARTEEDLSTAERWFLPKAQVEKNLAALRTGDIIGITTSIGGLDCSHTGLAVEEGGIIRFLHAPLSGGVVQFSRGSLAEYLAGHDKQTGIIVARPVAPVPPEREQAGTHP